MVKATPLQNFSGKAVVGCQGYFKVIALVLGTKVCKFESYLRHLIPTLLSIVIRNKTLRGIYETILIIAGMLLSVQENE